MRNLVFVDEAGLNLSMSRLFARAVKGERAVGNTPGSKGANVSLIGAININGLVAAMTVPGSTNTLGISYVCNSGLSTSIMERSNCCNG